MPVARHTECEGIAPFADAIYEPGEGDNDYESGESRSRGPNRCLQADFGKYRRERSENSGKKSPVRLVMRHLHEDPRE